jgi:ferrous iron transport protein B
MSRPLIVALAGNPNCGKTSVFNALTGLRQKVANYPGITVERKTGHARLPDGRDAEVIDLPGTYSLIAASPDEDVTTAVLRGLRADTPAPDVIVAVVDASNLPRNLYLLSHLLELSKPLVVALNMMDIVERRGQRLDVAALALELGVPVCPVVAHHRQGIDALLAAIATATVPAPAPAIDLPDALCAGVADLAQYLPGPAPLLTARRLLLGDGASDLADLHRSEPIQAHLLAIIHRLEAAHCEPVQAEIQARYQWIDRIATRCVTSATPGTTPRRTLTDRADGVLVHRVWGLAIFTGIMATLFTAIFWLAQPIMAGLQSLVGWLGGIATSHLGDGALKALVNDGVVNGVGSVVVFVPQIALLFFFLAILEDSGYLARAAFLMDRLLSGVGLHGKSFIPLLSSFACAIPGIMATRTIDARRERLTTILVAPFMSCSARLPVYALLIDAFFADRHPAVQGAILLGCYLLGIATAALIAWLGSRFARRGIPASFILEMPTYKVPQAAEVARQVWTNTSEFLRRAGTTIFCLCVLLWALTYFPRLSDEQIARVRASVPAAALTVNATPEHTAETNQQVDNLRDRAVAAAQLEHSAAGHIGHALEPVVAPLGADWKIGVGLVGAFAAREVFVSTMGILYSAGDTDDAAGMAAMHDRIRSDRRPDGLPVWTPALAIALLVWFVLAMQCLSTVAVVHRETGGWRWPLIQLAGMNILAWLASVVTFQILSHW